MSASPRHESGNYCLVEFRDTTVVKTTMEPIEEAAALTLVEDIGRYARQLATTPIQTVTLIDSRVIPDIYSGLFVVEHTQERIEGPRLDRMPWDERAPVARRVMGQLAAMNTLSDGKSLVVPIDAQASNFVVHPLLGPRFVDLVPALCRDDKGEFKAPNPHERTIQVLSDRLAVMARFAWTCLDLFGQGSSRRDILRQADVMCRTLLTDDLSKEERNSIRRQVLFVASASLERQAAFTHS